MEDDKQGDASSHFLTHTHTHTHTHTPQVPEGLALSDCEKAEALAET